MEAVPQDLPVFPAELVRAVHHQAEEDADRVAQFLAAVVTGQREEALPQTCHSLNFELLLEIGAILRIASWEEAGLMRAFPHLPQSSSALRDFLREFAATGIGANRSLSQQVLNTTIDQIAWLGETKLGTVALSHEIDEEEFGRNLAIFFWNHRHLLGETHEKTTGKR